jgi:hypothetical protein
MIVFDLRCSQAGHVFEVWFASSSAYEDQRARQLLICPICGDQDISKAVMAANVPAKSNSRSMSPPAETVMSAPATDHMAAEMKAMLSKIATMQAESIKSSQWVGKDFDQKARAMDAGEIDAASIHGQATPAQAKALMDDGISVMPLLIPIVPPDELN